MTHARDRVINYDQRTVVAVCGMKVKTGDSIFAGTIPAVVMRPDLTCVGCRAILRAREKVERPCKHVWDGPRIEVSPACSVATCSKCGEPAIEIPVLQPPVCPVCGDEPMLPRCPRCGKEYLGHAKFNPQRAETPVQPEAHESSSMAVQPEAHESPNLNPKAE